MRSFAFYLALLGCIGMAAGAKASIVTDFLRPGLSALEDTDFEIALTGGDTTVDIGDTLIAIAAFPAFADHITGTDYANFTSGTKMLTAISVATVTGKTSVAGGFGYEFDLGAPGAAAWAAVEGAVTAAVGAHAFDLSTISGSTVFAVFEDDDPPPAGAGGDHLDNTGIGVGLASASQDPGTLLAEFGFPGISADEFFFARTFDLTGSPDDITLIDSLTTYAGLNYTTPPSGMPLLAAHNFLGSALSGVPAGDKPLFTGPTIIQLQGSLGSLSPGGWSINTDTDAYVSRVVPEPMSIMVWTMLAAMVAGMGYIRRR
jgi:hypothetical protein